MNEEPEPPRPTDPERPPVGEDHVLRFPKMPPPMPMSEFRIVPEDAKLARRNALSRRRILIVAPVPLLMRDDIRPWLRRLAGHLQTAGSRATGSDIEILPDAESLVDQALDKLVATREIGTQDGKKTRSTRGIRLARSKAEWSAIHRTRTQAQFDVHYRFTGDKTPRDLRVELTVRGASVSVNGSRTFGGLEHNLLLSAPEFARLVYGEYDQLIWLTAEKGSSAVIRRERRGPKCWIVVFPNEDQGADWPQKHPA